jgi:hypothetical protein
MYGYLTFPPVGVHIRTEPGHTLPSAGHGCLMNPGDGYLITTVTGFFTPFISGYGFPVIHGLRRVLSGVSSMGITDGRLCLLSIRPFTVITVVIQGIAATIGIQDIRRAEDINRDIPAEVILMEDPPDIMQEMSITSGFRTTHGLLFPAASS